MDSLWHVAKVSLMKTVTVVEMLLFLLPMEDYSDWGIVKFRQTSNVPKLLKQIEVSDLCLEVSGCHIRRLREHMVVKSKRMHKRSKIQQLIRFLRNASS